MPTIASNLQARGLSDAGFLDQLLGPQMSAPNLQAQGLSGISPAGMIAEGGGPNVPPEAWQQALTSLRDQFGGGAGTTPESGAGQQAGQYAQNLKQLYDLYTQGSALLSGGGGGAGAGAGVGAEAGGYAGAMGGEVGASGGILGGAGAAGGAGGALAGAGAIGTLAYVAAGLIEGLTELASGKPKGYSKWLENWRSLAAQDAARAAMPGFATEIGATPSWPDLVRTLQGAEHGIGGYYGSAYLTPQSGQPRDVASMALDDVYKALQSGGKIGGNVVSTTGVSMGDVGLGDPVTRQVMLLHAIEAAGGAGAPGAKPYMDQLNQQIQSYQRSSNPFAYMSPDEYARYNESQRLSVGPPESAGA